MTWPSLTQTGIRTSFRAERTLTPNQSVICVEIDLAGPLRRLHETLHSIATYVMTPSRRAVFPSAKPTAYGVLRRFRCHPQPARHGRRRGRDGRIPDHLIDPAGGAARLRLFFTEAGLTALRAMMTDRRLVDPRKFAHVRQELGIDPNSEDEARD